MPRSIGEGLEQDSSTGSTTTPTPVLVAIDTLQASARAADGRRNAYEVDVEASRGSRTSSGTGRSGCSSSTTRKERRRRDDFLTSVSGTYGITGSADTILVIRRKRIEAFGTLVRHRVATSRRGRASRAGSTG